MKSHTSNGVGDREAPEPHHNNNAKTMYRNRPNSNSSISLSPVGPARRSLLSALQLGYSEFPDAQPSSLYWGSAHPPNRNCWNLWPYERLRAKFLSFRNLWQRANFCCMYCARLRRTALTFTLQVCSIISELTLWAKHR